LNDIEPTALYSYYMYIRVMSGNSSAI